jgi:uncharacterized membrane protein YgcG
VFFIVIFSVIGRAKSRHYYNAELVPEQFITFLVGYGHVQCRFAPIRLGRFFVWIRYFGGGGSSFGGFGGGSFGGGGASGSW